MPQHVSEAAKKAARTVNLYDYMTATHPDAVKREGESLRLVSNHSVSVKRGYSGYTDFADGSTGNSVDFLVKFLNYEFTDAVAYLCRFAGIPCDGPEHLSVVSVTQLPPEPPEPPQAPPPVLQQFIPPQAIDIESRNRQLYAYCLLRGFKPDFVRDRLVSKGLLYLTCDNGYHNLVFVNPERTYYEIRGTASKPFHQVGFSDPAAFWWFKPEGVYSRVEQKAYICESAIDAISLYLIHRDDKIQDMRDMDSRPSEHNPVRVPNCLYCSIGGVANQQRIDAIKAGMQASGVKVIIAVDNDDAGENCRKRNPDCQAIIPQHKDWNEDYIDIFDAVYPTVYFEPFMQM